MEELFRKLSLGFAAGAGGGAAKYGAYKVALETGILAWYKLPLAYYASFPGFLYKLVTLGGLFGFLLILPLLARSWLIRGVLVGVLATVADVLIFQSGSPFDAVPDFAKDVMNSVQTAFAERDWEDELKRITPVALSANIIWGLAASYWYDIIDR